MSNGDAGAAYGQAWNVAAYPGGYAAAPAASYGGAGYGGGGGGAPSWAGQYTPDLGKGLDWGNLGKSYAAAYWARASGQTPSQSLATGNWARGGGIPVFSWNDPYYGYSGWWGDLGGAEAGKRGATAWLAREAGATPSEALQAGERAMGFGDPFFRGDPSSFRDDPAAWWKGYKPKVAPWRETYEDVYTPKQRQEARTTTERVALEAAVARAQEAYPQLLQNPNVTPLVWELFSKAKAEADIEMPNKPAGYVWTTGGKVPLDWFAQNIMTQNLTETQFRWLLGERGTWAASQDPWEGGKITDPLTGETTGWETTTVPTTKKIRGVSYETGEPFELTEFPWGTEAAAYQQQKFYEETGERQGGGGGKVPTWMIPSPGDRAPWMRGAKTPQAWEEYWEAIQRGRLQPKDTKKLTPEEEAKLYARYGNIYELYQQEKAAGIAVEGGYYLTFDEWLEKTPEAMALWDERQRRGMFPQPTATARWLPAKQRVR